MSGIILGIDGCRGGWAVASLQNSSVSFSVIERLDELDFACVARVFIDIPIGIPESGRRSCDHALRALLPPNARPSVFYCPVYDAVYAADYAAARRISIEKTGKSMSIQAWNLCPKIIEAERFMTRFDASKPTVFESHPEWNWLRLAGTALDSKHTQNGRFQRQHLLAAAGIELPRIRRSGNILIKEDDWADAAVLMLAASTSLETGLLGATGEAGPDIWTFA